MIFSLKKIEGGKRKRNWIFSWVFYKKIKKIFFFSLLRQKLFLFIFEKWSERMIIRINFLNSSFPPRFLCVFEGETEEFFYFYRFLIFFSCFSKEIFKVFFFFLNKSKKKKYLNLYFIFSSLHFIAEPFFQR